MEECLMKISFVNISYKSFIEVSYENFYNELINHISCPENQKIIGVPIQCNEETKVNIKKYLKSLHIGNEVNALIAFFERIPIGNCYYIIPIELDEDTIDELQNKLKYYNEKYDEDYVKKNMDQYYKHTNFIREKAEFYYENYIQKYYKFKKIQKLGTTNRKNRKCIYCGRKQEDGATFRNVSHAIPEALGNKTLIQNEECDECNDAFGKGIEKKFIDFIGVIRTIGGIRGKNNKVPIFEKNGITIEYDENIDGVKEINVPGEHCESFVNEESLISIEELYRFLCKMIIGVIDEKYRNDLKNIIRWVRYGEVPEGINKEKYKLPPIGILMNAEILKEPDIALFIRKNNNYNIPYCFSCVRVANLIFVYVIPFTNKDSGFNDREKFIEFFNKTLFKNYKFMFTNQFNFDSLYLRKIIPIKEK